MEYSALFRRNREVRVDKLQLIDIFKKEKIFLKKDLKNIKYSGKVLRIIFHKRIKPIIYKTS